MERCETVIDSVYFFTYIRKENFFLTYVGIFEIGECKDFSKSPKSLPEPCEICILDRKQQNFPAARAKNKRK